ncbi:MAG: hypothetical protein K6A28_00215 [Bacteroidales bacterium]|nr:hypothetical protein [Bacteroidales bacterium]
MKKTWKILAAMLLLIVVAFAAGCEKEVPENGGDDPVVPQEDSTGTEGMLSGVFSVSGALQVHFSQGNLQYQASTGTWRFAEHQWSYVGATEPDQYGHVGGNVEGSSNHLISETYDGWIDQFGWGTSGFDHGAVCYQPYSTSTMYWDYYAYGSDTCNLYDQTGKADWGYNAISNGGNAVNRWRTLTIAEWHYLLFERHTESSMLFAKASVDGVNGLVLLPDDWNASNYSFTHVNVGGDDASFNDNLLSLSQWDALESEGAVFLPASCFRYGSSVQTINAVGHYWSSSKAERTSAYYMSFGNLSVSTEGDYYNYPGRAVRLVRCL